MKTFARTLIFRFIEDPRSSTVIAEAEPLCRYYRSWTVQRFRVCARQTAVTYTVFHRMINCVDFFFKYERLIAGRATWVEKVDRKGNVMEQKWSDFKFLPITRILCSPTSRTLHSANLPLFHPLSCDLIVHLWDRGFNLDISRMLII